MGNEGWPMGDNDYGQAGTTATTLPSAAAHSSLVARQPSPAGRPTWAEIDLGAVAANVAGLCALVGPGTRVMAVVKAGGYGHGAAPVARAALRAGAAWLGVSSMEEAVELRQAGIGARTLILGHLPPEQAHLAALYAITPTVSLPEQLEQLARAARRLRRRATAHVKLDTGMARLGLSLPELRCLLRQAARWPEVEVEGCYTHLSCADEPGREETAEQLAHFREGLAILAGDGFGFRLRHAANSAGALYFPTSRLDMVRCGLAIYGYWPEQPLPAPGLRPALAIRSRVVRLMQVPAGSPVGYGGTLRTTRPSTLAVLPIGYADGVSRLLSNRGRVLVRGRAAPIAGRVSMDLLTVDVTDVPGAALGDEAVVVGRQGHEEIRLEELAALAGTIPYEIMCGLSLRVRRVYLGQPSPAESLCR